jgi:hypothetical protein
MQMYALAFRTSSSEVSRTTVSLMYAHWRSCFAGGSGTASDVDMGVAGGEVGGANEDAGPCGMFAMSLAVGSATYDM